MMPTERGLIEGLAWLVSVAGLVALVALRRRSPRAAGLALPVVAAMLVVEAAFVLQFLAPGLPSGVRRAGRAVTDATPFTHGAGLLVLAVAVMADRRPRRPA